MTGHICIYLLLLLPPIHQCTPVVCTISDPGRGRGGGCCYYILPLLTERGAREWGEVVLFMSFVISFFEAVAALPGEKSLFHTVTFFLLTLEAPHCYHLNYQYHLQKYYMGKYFISSVSEINRPLYSYLSTSFVVGLCQGLNFETRNLRETTQSSVVWVINFVEISMNIIDSCLQPKYSTIRNGLKCNILKDELIAKWVHEFVLWIFSLRLKKLLMECEWGIKAEVGLNILISWDSVNSSMVQLMALLPTATNRRQSCWWLLLPTTAKANTFKSWPVSFLQVYHEYAQVIVENVFCPYFRFQKEDLKNLCYIGKFYRCFNFSRSKFRYHLYPSLEKFLTTVGYDFSLLNFDFVRCIIALLYKQCS